MLIMKKTRRNNSNHMAIKLDTLTYNKKSRKKRKVVGRGNASGHGTYSGRGSKGQRARSGGKKGLKLKGFKRILLNLPKFKGLKPVLPKQEVTLSDINKNFTDGSQITPQILAEKNLVKNPRLPVKILNTGEISIKIEVQSCLVSKGAKAAIEKAGGQVEVEAPKVEVENKK